MGLRLRSRCVLGLGLLAALLPVHAADLKVRVVDAAGNPAAGVAVLVDAQRMKPDSAARPRLEIRQRNLRFSPALSVVPVGTEVLFTNDDDFDHHVVGTSEKTRFEFSVPAVEDSPNPKSKAAKRTPAVAMLTHSGVVALSCHLHSSMRGHILVTEAAYSGVTDAKGEIRFTDLRGGQAAINTWHPLLLTRAASTVTHVGDQAAEATIRLNVVLPAPRR